MKIVDVKYTADIILDKITAIPHKSKSLLILYAGDNPASASYMKGKIKDCTRCGIPVKQTKCESYKDLLWQIRIGNHDDTVGGIIVQLPLPDGWDESVVNQIDPAKDVDGFTHDSPFAPCTPEGIVYLARHILGDLTGKTALIVGRGKLVGHPLHDMLQNEQNMTVMTIHSKTVDADYWKYYHRWDVVVVATGVAETLDLSRVNADLVIDAGIHRGADGKLHGDCYNNTDQPGWVTPVPGGVGLMTRAMLMRHMARVQ